MIRRNVWITAKVALAIPKNVNPTQEDENKADAEKNPQGHNRIATCMNNGQIHFSPKIDSKGSHGV
jgi:hypothetical protein